MPCQDEALNDRSSMPPVSVTMQPRNLPAVDADELLLALADAELEPLVFDVLLPHAAASRPATVSTALAARVFFTGYLLFRGAPLPPVCGQSPPRDLTLTRAGRDPIFARASPRWPFPTLRAVMFQASGSSQVSPDVPGREEVEVPALHTLPNRNRVVAKAACRRRRFPLHLRCYRSFGQSKVGHNGRERRWMASGNRLAGLACAGRADGRERARALLETAGWRGGPGG